MFQSWNIWYRKMRTLLEGADYRNVNDHSIASGCYMQAMGSEEIWELWKYGWEDLNKKYDNHKVPIDCYDPKIGLYHQVQGRRYNYRNKWWSFSGFEDEWEKIFEDMVCFCYSKDGKIVERIYDIIKEEIEKRKGVSIVKNPMNTTVPWYEKYRIKDEDELKKANEMWKDIIKEK